MKQIITIISVFISSIVFSQNLDSLTFKYINVYRVNNGKQPLIWSDLLYKNCLLHSKAMITKDSIYHSNLPYYTAENVNYNDKSAIDKPNIYKNFIKKQYNLSYEEVLKDSIKYLATTEVYCWAMSPKHNEIMLSNRKEGAVHVLVKSINRKDNMFKEREIFHGYGRFIFIVHSGSTFQLK